MKLDRVLDFVRFTHKFQQVKRLVIVNGENRQENDTEHSYQLAMLSWFLNEGEKLGLDSNMLIKYSMVHDLVETYAGDIPVPIYKDLEFDRGKKKEKEKMSLERIKIEFPEFREMVDLIERYEKKEDEESQFVCSLDKLITVLNIFTDDGRSWQEHGVDFEKLMVLKNSTITHKDVKKFWEEIRQVISLNKDELFV